MGLEIRLFGEPEILRDGKAVTLGAALPTLALFILWRHRGGMDAETLAGALKPVSEAETDRTSFLKKHKKTLRDRLGLTLPETLKLTALGPAISEQAWVDVVHFDEKIGSGERRCIDEALALRSRGPLLAGLQEPAVLAAERAQREAKYLTALRRLFEASRDQPQEALRLLELQMDCDGLSEDEAERLRGARLTLEEELFRSRTPAEDGKTTRRGPLLFLPIFPTALIGREAESAAVEARLSAPGLVTLTGPAGIGKTRLAVAAAARLQESFPGGAGFADLAAASNAEQITAQICAVLGLMEEKERSRRETLLLFLAEKTLLLVWDNCEHLTGDCADLAAEVLQRCPAVRLLATSREALHVYGERLYPLPVLTEDSAVWLFQERAQAVSPNFEMTEQNRALVQKICRDLDGLPLALELAAALLPIRTVAEVAGSLDKRFALLVDGPRGGPSRHASLEAAFDLSYALLSPAEQALFRTLGVFAGSFSRDAAEAVCAMPDTSTLLTRLVRKSLVNAEENSDEIRFRLLASLRQYAEDKLRVQGEWEEMRRRHRDYFLALAEEAEPHLRGPKQKGWLDRLEAEHDNFRAALGLQTDEQALRLACALRRFWWVRGYLDEGLRWLARGIDDASDVSDQVKATALIGAGRLSHVQGRYKEAQKMFQGSLALQTRIGNARGIAAAHHNLADAAFPLGQYEEVEMHYQISLAEFRRLGDKEGIADALMGLGNIEQNQSRYASARERHTESLELRRDLGDPQGIADSLMCLNNIALRQGDLAEARTTIEECFSILQRLDSRKRMAESLIGFGRVALAEGKSLEAQTLLEQSLALSQEIGHQWIMAQALNYLANIADSHQNYVQVEVLLRQSLAVMESLGAERAVAALQGNLGSALTRLNRFVEAKHFFFFSLKTFRQTVDRESIASLLEGYAAMKAAEGKNSEAVALWGSADALASLIGFCRPANEDAYYNQTVFNVREVLGTEAFVIAWAEGQAMTWEQAVGFALEEMQP